MACVTPLQGWKSRKRLPSGKRGVTFKYGESYSDMRIEVACGRCIGCRKEYARQWAMRCLHEASLFDENSFVTLTYDDKHLPAGGTLVKRDVQLFLKRLRRKFSDRTIRYFFSGEYGGDTLRPHYHGCLFGFAFPDQVAFAP